MDGTGMRDLRKQWHWTQAQLGEWLGYNLQTISRYERDLDAIPLAVQRLMHYEALFRQINLLISLYLKAQSYDGRSPRGEGSS